jgi:(p)ppGpp synthase/HD superfamily hydrolase
MLKKAIEIATEAHKGATDKYGSPYINHVTRVMNLGATEEEKIVGVLHDVVEDTHWTFEKLTSVGFSSEIMEALKCVTKISEEEDYEEFTLRVSRNPLAVKVKINDLTDNMDIRRIPVLTEKDLIRLMKYHKAYRFLTSLD